MTLMRRHTTLTLALPLALGLTLVAGTARADGPGDAYVGMEIGTSRYIDHAQNLVVLINGNEFRTTDPRMLLDLKEGEFVMVDFTHDGDRSTINSIEPADANGSVGARPITEPGPYEN
jgi:hypothetical protein